MAKWPPKKFELIRGPQDGAFVKRIGDVMPQTIYVGKQDLGDRYAAYGIICCERFPCCYVLDGYRFVFKGA